ncbi:hypothetical protein WS90_25750 [Burkholderia cepacia]|uniref:Uncharacterized protein n=1 Tax=Burkholderia cepacia TaxID=292 RepID=A0A118KEN7_BURCE|nr:hypothetical protein WS90_25750 [Burkholderia cepacia]
MLERNEHAFGTLLHAGNGTLAETLLTHGGRQHGQMQCPFTFGIQCVTTAMQFLCCNRLRMRIKGIGFAAGETVGLRRRDGGCAIALHDFHLPGIAIDVFLVFADYPAFLIQDGYPHGDEALAQIVERHLLPDLRIRFTHRAFEIHAPYHLIGSCLVAKHHVVRVAARRIVLVRRTTMLTQFADVPPRSIGLVICAVPVHFRDRRLRCGRMNWRGWRSSVDGRTWVTLRRGRSHGRIICATRRARGSRRTDVRRALDAIVQPRLSAIRQTSQVRRFRLVAAHLDTAQRALQPRLAAKFLVTRHANAPPRFRMHHVDHRLDHVRPVVLGDEVRPQILERKLIRRILQEILIARTQVTLAHAFGRLIKRCMPSICLSPRLDR